MTEWQNTLLSWYDEHGRILPWREVEDPYKIWVSEIILQQTRVAQGLEYYHRFLQAFPTVEHLASADEDIVMQVWQGLGYYSRARNMQCAARQIVEQGGFPTDYSGVHALKGVGDYTAAAICSFAFSLPYAVVDGNVYRVLARYFCIKTPIDTTSGKKQFNALAQSLLQKSRSARYNQAIMDFGALQCTPSSPQCSTCPFSNGCLAYGSHSVGQYPVKSHKMQVKNRYFVYLLIDTPEGIWLHRRAAGDIWQGLYEMPLLEFSTPTALTKVLQHAFVRNIKQLYSLSTVATNVKHVLTHRCIFADCYRLSFTENVPIPDGYVSVPHSRISDYAVSRLVDKLLQRALQNKDMC